MSAVSSRAVVTGMGSLNPLGATVPETWTAMLAGRSGIAALSEDWAQALPVRMAGRVTADLGVPAEHPRAQADGPLRAARARCCP